MALTLLTGAQGRVHGLAIALKAEGFDVVEGPQQPDLVAPVSVDCHIHLAEAEAEAGAGRPGDEPPDTGAVRCRIVLVPESPGDEVTPSEVALLRAVVDAALGQPGRRLRVEIASRPRPPGGRFPTPAAAGRRNWSRYAELEPDLAYADWRNEVMAMMSDG